MSRTLINTAWLASAMLAAAASLPAHAAGANTNTDTTVVLVHGAFADGSSWEKVIPLLQAKGLKVVAVQNPLTSLADDVAAAQRVIDAQSGRVILVGHSWAGAVITQAGANDKVKALVYVAAFAPAEGEVIGQLGEHYPVTPGIASLKPDASGIIYMSAESMAANYASDLPAATARVMAATQAPIWGKAFGDSVSVAAWKTRPSYYIVCSKDRMIQPALEQAFAKKINAITTVLSTSHVPMLSQPKAVAEVILAAAKA
ncbi:alpha/beta fold hydrolase [Undibacterium sp.]|uniref:alpha/beta fold hydrolase n=1 Tax=Undibacterium sp. TaxID=1914977 RepID=UPI00374D2FDA